MSLLKIFIANDKLNNLHKVVTFNFHYINQKYFNHIIY